MAAEDDTLLLESKTLHIQQEILFANPDSALALAYDLFKEAELAGSVRYMATALLIKGNALYLTSQFVFAADYATRSLKMYETISDIKGMSDCYNLLANLYADIAERNLAIAFYEKSLALREKCGDRKGVAASLNNLGLIYSDLFDEDKSEIHRSKAEKYLKRSIVVSREVGFTRNLANALINLGLNYHRDNQLQKALDYYFQSLEIKKSNADAQGMVYNYSNIALAYMDLDQLQQALEYARKAMDFAQSTGGRYEQSEVAKILSDIYKKGNQPAKALEMYEKHITLRDSILNDENRSEITRMRYQYEFEKKEALSNAEREKQAALAEEEIRRKDIQRSGLLVVLGFALALVTVIYFGYKRKKRDNELISKKKAEVEEVNLHLTESIVYAQKLQEAVLPAPEVPAEHFSEYFLIFMPKDVVSGDFYWVEKKEGVIYLAVGDCTGHGVPGAMLSVVGINGLNRCVREAGITAPHLILEELTRLFLSTFERSASTVRDGMDIALCAIDRAKRKLFYAGANIPLLIARQGEIIILKSDRRPVGFHDAAHTFSQQEIDLMSGDVIYLISDGYADQIGGPKSQKFKTRYFRENLQSMLSMPLKSQYRIIIEKHVAWRGSEVQTDDICMLAVRID